MGPGVIAKTLETEDDNGPFRLTVIEDAEPVGLCIFAVGRGGSPERHLPLLNSVAKRGCTVVAPHFDMLASGIPTKAELDTRIVRLNDIAMTYARDGQPIVGLGHSIGTVALLTLAGGKAETAAGDKLGHVAGFRFARLALLAPPTDFFRRPGALHAVHVPVEAWAGRQDTITPPRQAMFLEEALGEDSLFNLHIDDDAGHFTFMDELPAGASEPHPDRRTFRHGLAHEVANFLVPAKVLPSPGDRRPV